MASATLVQGISKYAYKKGSFVLSSGETSTYYFDLKQVTLHPLYLQEIASQVFAEISPDDFSGVGGPTLGADPLAAGLSLKAAQLGFFLPAFIVRKEPKKHGTSQWIEGVEHLNKKKPLLVIEDVMTTGKSSLSCIQKLEAEGFSVGLVVCVLNREQGGDEALKQKGYTVKSLVRAQEILGNPS